MGIQNKSLLALLVLCVSNDSDMKEQLLDLTALKDTTPGTDIKATLDTAHH
jgi:hypothetical protein